MFPAIGGEPLSSKLLDPGRDDYYGHAGSWTDTQDSPWLVRLDGQAPLALDDLGPGLGDRERARPPLRGELHDDLERRSAARPGRDAERRVEARSLERSVLGHGDLQRHRCPGRVRERGVRPGVVPAQRLGQREGSGPKLASGHHVPPALLGRVPLVQPGPPHGDAGEGLEASLVERRLPRREERSARCR